MKSKILILFSILIFGCSQSTNFIKQFTPNELKLEIAKLNAEAERVMLNNDFQSTIKNYTKDAISLPDYQPMAKGLEAIKRNIDMQLENPTTFTKFTLISNEIWQEGNLVIDIGLYDMSMKIPEMPDGEYTDHGKYLTIYEVQSDGSLLVKAETWNSNENPWMKMGQ
jgi:ketosteroid isomerase-like protein